MKIKLVLLGLIFMFSSCVYSQEETVHDYLYSEEYFDYLIESANDEFVEHHQEEISQPQENMAENEVTIFEFDNPISDSYEPFKLQIQEDVLVGTYNETFKKEDTKTIIPIGNKFSIIQNTTKFRNKYNSDDYRVLAGVELSPFKFFNIESGLETNYRGIDQNPTSRKAYFTPTLYINDKLSLSFYNKVNLQTKSTDHDIGINISPFKSKAVDFRVYTGITQYQNGTKSESINLYTNFYFY